MKKIKDFNKEKYFIRNNEIKGIIIQIKKYQRNDIEYKFFILLISFLIINN